MQASQQASAPDMQASQQVNVLGYFLVGTSLSRSQGSLLPMSQVVFPDEGLFVPFIWPLLPLLSSVLRRRLLVAFSRGDGTSG